MRAWPGVFLSIGCFLHFTLSVADAAPRSILVLEQSDVRGPFYAAIFNGLRAKVNQWETGPVTLYVENLDLSRFRGEAYEQTLSTYFGAKYEDNPVGVIVAVGAGALDYALRWRPKLWPGVPIVFAFVDETSFGALRLPPGVTGRLTRLRLGDMVAGARAVVPDLERVAIVGDDLATQPVFRHLRGEIPEVSETVAVTDLTGLPIAELKERLASLPARSAILYTAVYSDGAGTYFPPADALAMIAGAANRPIIAPVESYVGRGAIGGYVVVPSIVGAEAGELALRILDGEKAEDIPIGVGESLRPVFDWPQLKRWGVDERVLPPGSELRDRTPTVWEEYNWEIVATAVVLLVQTCLIAALLYEHDRRHKAELEASRRMAELAHMNRRATAGELSSTIAHELNQPLGAVQNNASAALLLVARPKPDLVELGQILKEIKRDNMRAGEVIERVRRLVRNAPSEVQDVDIGNTVREVFDFVGPQASAAGVSLERAQATAALVVRGDPVQLQQVVLNLVLNAIDSASARIEGEKRVEGRTRSCGEAQAEVAITDSGCGVAADRLAAIFQPFVTTKREGMGLGLSIARSIIETHGGSIWAENGKAGGAVFRFTLPLVATANGAAP